MKIHCWGCDHASNNEIKGKLSVGIGEIDRPIKVSGLRTELNVRIRTPGSVTPQNRHAGDPVVHTVCQILAIGGADDRMKSLVLLESFYLSTFL